MWDKQLFDFEALVYELHLFRIELIYKSAAVPDSALKIALEINMHINMKIHLEFEPGIEPKIAIEKIAIESSFEDILLLEVRE